MEIGKTKKREKRGSAGATRAFRGVGFYSFVFFFPSFLPGRWDVDHARCFRYCSRERRGRDTERRNGDGSQERVKDGKKISKARGLAARTRVRTLERIARDFVLTLARGCVSLTPQETFRIPINSRHNGIVNFRERNSWLRLTLCCKTTDLSRV